MESVKQFNGLNGAQITREKLEGLKALAEKEKQRVIANRIAAFLGRFPDDTVFIVENESPAMEQLAETDISHFEELPQGEETQDGLGKPVSPDDIYQAISDKIAALLEEDLNWEKEWAGISDKQGYLIAYNFDTKKPYRGINRFLLGSLYILDPSLPLLENPYYLTMKQVNKHGGKVKKGTNAVRAIYFTRLFKYRQAEPELEFSTYDIKKMIAFLNANRDKIEPFNAFTSEEIAQQNYYPILKYYNLFNGKDVEGIDFDLANFKGRGFIKKMDSNDHNKIEEAEAIISHYPKPSPKLKYGGDRAFFISSTDTVQMPLIGSFKYVQAYYTTFFHELVHSTGSKKRLDRAMGKKIGDKNYAFEELTAELGACFLSGQAGILHYTIRNSAAYIKSWRKNLLAIVKKDNRFFFRASSKAQAAADFILQKDSDGVPKYLKKIKPGQKKTAKLIPMKKITIGWTEGKTTPKNKFPKDFSTWQSANQALVPVLDKEAGYNKTGFLVLFADKEEWEGTLYVSEKEDNPRKSPNVIGQHIYDYIQYALTGEICTSYKDLIPSMKEFLTKYDLGTIKKFPKGLGDPRRQGIAKDALTDCGRAVKGFRFEKGGKIVKVRAKKKQPTKKTPKTSVKKTSKKNQELVKSIKTRVKSTQNQKNNYVFSEGTKKTNRRKKNGLSSPIVLDSGAPFTANPPSPAADRDAAAPVWDTEVKEPQTVTATPVRSVKKRPATKKNGLVKKMTDLGRQNAEYFKTVGDLGRFMGNIERKANGSVVCTLDAPQGAMKTRLFFQKINMFASKGYNVLFISLEEDPDSVLFTGKRDQYISPENKDRVDTVGELPNGIRDLEKLIPDYDVIFIDSWGKLLLLNKNLDLDLDIRKKYNGKLFFVIYQRTGTGTMRGGSAAKFDADMVMKIKKDPDYTQNHAFFDKNRYEAEQGLKYKIHGQSILEDKEAVYGNLSASQVELV